VGLQAKLLRVLQEKEITRIGSNDTIKVDVRLIATSNRNLEESVRKGEFREDLYFRLNVVNLRLPSLRERPADVPKLAQFYADKYADVNGLSKKKLSPGAAAKMAGYTWPGNIRELENAMHRAILVSVDDQIEADAININTTAAPPVIPAKTGIQVSAETPGTVKNEGAVVNLIGRKLEDVERDMILNTLDHALGNRTHAANILGISIRTLRNKLNQYKEAGVNIPTGTDG
jgi:two-component system, response regulator FlrC